MERATGLASTVERGASMAGAAVAGGLVAPVGPANALVVDALSFLLGAAVLAWSTLGPGRHGGAGARGVTEHPTRYLVRLREGWSFLRGDRVLLGIAVMVALTNLLDIAWATVLVPVWARESGGGATAIGLLFAAFSGASVLGAVCAAAIGERLPRSTAYLLAFLVSGAPRFVVLALDVPLWTVLAVAVAGGFASGFINPVLGAVVFERIPEPLVGRVSSLTTAMCFALMPLGGLLGGGMVAGVGPPAALLAIGGAYLLITTAPVLDPRWRELDDRPEPVTPRGARAVHALPGAGTDHPPAPPVTGGSTS